MATYFNKYYLEFDDIHITSPARWRVDIMDSQGSTPTEPFLLQAAANPLVIERVDTSDDKFAPIIGRQISIRYLNQSGANEPLPEEFFDSAERRFRVEVRKNGVLDGVYFIKPDFSEYPDSYPPYEIELRAIDGLGYSKGTLINAYEPDGLLAYRKMSIYEILVTRGLFRIFDEGTPVNVLQSLKPVEADPVYHMLFDNSVHLDIFYTFVEGASSVYDVMVAFCKAFRARIMTDQNQIWFLRVQDLKQDSYNFDQYLSESAVNTLTVPGFLRIAGQTTSNDGVPINRSGRFTSLPAVKKSEYEVDYKGINYLQNFQWDQWDGSDFAFWFRPNSIGEQITLQRTGGGTIDDPYKAFMPYPNSEIGFRFWQIPTSKIVSVGDIIEFEIKAEFFNVREFGFRIVLVDEPSAPVYNVIFVLGADGAWLEPGQQANQITRSGKKRITTYKLKSLPVPAYAFNGDGPYQAFGIRLEIMRPSTPDPIDPGFPDGVSIYPVKVGIISIASKGRHLTIRNAADFSQVKETEKFTFIDTGEDGLSNTIFLGNNPVSSWGSPKPDVWADDIERQMAKAMVDQYQRSVTKWDGQLYSNSVSFYNVIQLAHKPEKLFMQSADRYSARSALHDISMIEIFPEGSGEVQDIIEYDVEDTTE